MSNKQQKHCNGSRVVKTFSLYNLLRSNILRTNTIHIPSGEIRVHVLCVDTLCIPTDELVLLKVGGLIWFRGVQRSITFRPFPPSSLLSVLPPQQPTRTTPPPQPPPQPPLSAWQYCNDNKGIWPKSGGCKGNGQTFLLIEFPKGSKTNFTC